ncbi:MAG: DUF1343 domain-containing protein [Deltaproteobacteria bacterium]|nr:DUF1343 domain-containing protein [Deltaproteobacteria bacterium]
MKKSVFRFILNSLLVLAFLGLEAHAAVLPGIEQLFSAPFAQLLAHRRVGVLAHFASRALDGTHVVDLLRKQVDLRVIFAPEHGFRGTNDEQVPDSRDPVTGLPVYSLYGPRRAPSADELAQIDVLVIDLQDVGMRFYTYSATVAWTLQSCASAHKPVVLLDRPNPIGGTVVEGAVLDPRYRGKITSFYPTTMRHGMTLGELARLYNTELKIGADLTVVPVMGWRRGMLWRDTGIRWFAPSPALTTSDQALLYGLFGVLETFNISVGRSLKNADAFRVYGAPWITATESRRLAVDLRKLKLPGLRFTQVEWKSERSNFVGQRCRGFRVDITDARRLKGFRSLIAVMQVLRAQFGARLEDDGDDVDLGASWVRQAVDANRPFEEIRERASREAADFMAERERVLLYR